MHTIEGYFLLLLTSNAHCKDITYLSVTLNEIWLFINL
jgi:hypothetical protein